METINPVVAWREDKGLSRRNTAILAHINYSQIAAAELGLVAKLPRLFLEVIATLDGPERVVAIERAYNEWRTAEAQTMTQQLAHS